MNKKFFCILASAALTVQGAGLSVLAAEPSTPSADKEATDDKAAAKIVYSGEIGTAKWTIDSNGNLVIGAGEFEQLQDEYSFPWSPYKKRVKKIVGTERFVAKGKFRNVFLDFENVVDINLSGWDISQCLYLDSMFSGCSSLERINIKNWDTSNVIEMYALFHGCTSLQTLDIGSWDVSSVTGMSTMFCGCGSLKELNINDWDVSQVRFVDMMFSGCASLTELDLSKWNTDKFRYMDFMFCGCFELETLDISSWSTSGVSSTVNLFVPGLISRVHYSNKALNIVRSLSKGIWYQDGEGPYSLWHLPVLEDGQTAWLEKDMSGKEPYPIDTQERTVTLRPGGSYTVDVPAGFPRPTITLSSSDFLKQEGMSIQALKTGKVYAVVSFPETDQYRQTSYRIMITISEDAKIPYPINTNDTRLSLQTGDTYTIESSAELPEPTVTSADPQTVSCNGLELNALKAGESTVTVTYPESDEYFETSYRIIIHVTDPGTEEPNPIERIEMHRLYNPNSGEHFYTADTKEKDNLVKLGWEYENIGWIAPETSETPVYRLYNKNAGDHHYTTSEKEKDYLVSVGWTFEKIGWYSADESGLPLYRQYNPNAKTGSHNYTLDLNEHEFLVSNGWKDEDIAWYGLK